MNKLRLGALGLGPRGRNMISAYSSHEEVEIAGLCDLFDKNLEAALLKLNNPSLPVYKDFDEMLDECQMDALYIAMPPTIQVDYACRAMERGLHVLCEPPCTYTTDECWKLVDTVEKTGIQYMMAEQLRYGYCFKQWREMYDSGEFGKMLFVEGQYTHYEKWGFYTHRETGDVVTDLENFEADKRYSDIKFDTDKKFQASDFTTNWRHDTFSHPIYYLPHELSPILSVFNDRVTEVTCYGNELEVALMRTEKDAIIRLMTAFSTYCHSGHWFHFMGSKIGVESSRIGYDDFAISVPLLWTKDNGWEKRPDWTYAHTDAEELARNSGHGGMDWYPIRNFVNMILHGGPNTMDVYRAVETAAPAIIAAQSCELGGVKLQIPDFRAKYGRDINKAYKI